MAHAGVHAQGRVTGSATAAGTGKWTIMLRLIQLLRSQQLYMAITVIVGIVHHLSAIAAVGTSAYIVGMAVSGASLSELYGSFWLLGCAVLLRAAMYWAEMYMAHDVAYRILADMRVRMFDKLEQLSPGGLMKARSGDIVSTVMSDIETTEWFYAHTLGTFLVAVIVPAGTLIALGLIHPLLPAVLLPFLIVLGTVPFWLSRKAEEQGQQLRERLGVVNSEVVDGVQGLRELVSFGRQDEASSSLARHNESLVSEQLAYGRRLGAEGAAAAATASLGMLALLATSVWVVRSGDMDPSLLPLAIVLSIFIFNPITEVVSILRRLGIMTAASRRIFAFMEAKPPVEDQTSAMTAQVCRELVPQVEFKQVSFRYEEELENALKGVTFTVSPGETVALVGHSGAGKSTCTHLLMRFWDVEEGSIEIGGVDIRDMSQEALREMIALVPQDIYLFHATIRENVMLGEPDATDEQVRKAAEAAMAHSFIESMPDGYETMAGERGLYLSGGQRQRIAIARALLKDAPILVMDEAVSNLDTENERELQQAVARLKAGRTTLIIAHRLSTIRSADKIVVLENGRVAEIGKHEELLRKQGAYSKLIHRLHQDE